MIVLGLTGSIGMGKTTTAGLFEEAGAPVFDSDAAVHALYAPGGAAVEPVGALFPETVVDGAIDRGRLAPALHDPQARASLEAIVHPLVREAQKRFLQAQVEAGAKVVVLDIPLLFETGQDALMDAVVVVTAPEELQRARVLARPGWTPERLAAVLALQTPDAEKRQRADFVVNTAFGIEEARVQVRAILEALREPA